MLIHKTEILYDVDLATTKIASRYRNNPDVAFDVQTGEEDRDMLIRSIDLCVSRIRQIYPNKDSITTDNKTGNEDDIKLDFSFSDKSVSNTVALEIHNYIVNAVLFDYLKVSLPEEALVFKNIADNSFEEVKSLIRRTKKIRRSVKWL